MIFKKFEFSHSDQQWPDQAGGINEKLAGATHVETFTKVEYQDERTLVVFAFYPDKEPVTLQDLAAGGDGG